MLQKSLRSLRNTRELRAAILDLAAELADRDAEGQVTVVAPVISEAAIREEWDRLMPALAPAVRGRLNLLIQPAAVLAPGTVPLDRPNYRFEVLRLLLGAALENDGPQPEQGIAAHIDTQAGLIDVLGASPTPVRSALTILRDAGLIHSLTWLEVAPEAISTDLLSRIGALPQTLRFRFERGARIKSPAELVQRTLPLLGARGPATWRPFCLSGAPAAVHDVPDLDLAGTPRVDLLAHIPRASKTFDTTLLRLLDDGLELEPNILAPAPVVVTLVRADRYLAFPADSDHPRRACPMDVFLSLLDMGLREQALHYARSVRQ